MVRVHPPRGAVTPIAPHGSTYRATRETEGSGNDTERRNRSGPVEAVLPAHIGRLDQWYQAIHSRFRQTVKTNRMRVMRFTVIEGGKSKDYNFTARDGKPTPEAVRREASRRRDILGLNRHRVREMAVGVPVPAKLRYLEIQIEFVAECLLNQDDIPEDFRSDKYWPA